MCGGTSWHTGFQEICARAVEIFLSNAQHLSSPASARSFRSRAKITPISLPMQPPRLRTQTQTVNIEKHFSRFRKSLITTASHPGWCTRPASPNESWTKVLTVLTPANNTWDNSARNDCGDIVGLARDWNNPPDAMKTCKVKI